MSGVLFDTPLYKNNKLGYNELCIIVNNYINMIKEGKIMNNCIGVKVYGTMGNEGDICMKPLWPVEGVKGSIRIPRQQLTINGVSATTHLHEVINSKNYAALLKVKGSEYDIVSADESNGVVQKKVLAMLVTHDFLLDDGSVVKLTSVGYYGEYETWEPVYENAYNKLLSIGRDTSKKSVVFDVFDGHVVKIGYGADAVIMNTLNVMLSHWSDYQDDTLNAIKWCRENAPDAVKHLSDEELWDVMKDAYYDDKQNR